MALITDTTLYTPISATELHSADVHNRPHNQMIDMLQDINKHHSRALVHDGQFIVTGALTVNGTTVVTCGTSFLEIQDKNIELNYQGDPANAQYAGFTVAGSSTAQDKGVRYNSSRHSKWEVFTPTSTGALTIVEPNFPIQQTAPGVSGYDAITYGQLSSIPVPASPTVVSLSANSQSYNLSAGTYLFSIDKDGDFGINGWLLGNSQPTWLAVKVAGTGTQNACFVTGASNAIQYDYNGDTWVVSPATFGLQYAVMTGLKNSALGFGGYDGTANAIIGVSNGLVWSWPYVMNVARMNMAGFGTRYDSMVVGGTSATGDANALLSSERFDGFTSFNRGNLASALSCMGGTGKANAGLVIGGKDTASIVQSGVYSYNGFMDSWAVISNLITARYDASCFGTYNSTTVTGGTTSAGITNNTEKWNGFTWSAGPSNPYSKNGSTSIGASNLGMVTDGTANSYSLKFYGTNLQYKMNVYNDAWKGESTSEQQIIESIYPFSITIEFLLDVNSGANTDDKQDNSELQREDFRDGVWSAQSNLNIARHFAAGAGLQNNAYICGGSSATSADTLTSTEIFDGTSWSIGNNMVAARYQLGAAGSRNAGINFGGSYTGFSEKFIGGTWTLVGGFSARSKCIGFGSFNGAIAAGGTGAVVPVYGTQMFNGTSWASLSGSVAIVSPTSGAVGFAGTGTLNAGFAAGKLASIRWNGVNWSLAPLSNSPADSSSMTGVSNAAMKIGGYTTTYLSTTEKFNGLYWIVSGSISSAKQGSSSAGSQMSGLVAGGEIATNTPTNLTDKYNSVVQMGYTVQTLLTTKIG